MGCAVAHLSYCFAPRAYVLGTLYLTDYKQKKAALNAQPFTKNIVTQHLHMRAISMLLAGWLSGAYVVYKV